jgi:ribosomal protein S18 acetylase RimI-like enzyme
MIDPYADPSSSSYLSFHNSKFFRPLLANFSYLSSSDHMDFLMRILRLTHHQDSDKILFSVFKDPGDRLKITEIGSTVVFVNTDEETIKIFNVYILEKYRGNKLCPIMMNLVVINLFNKKTIELDKKITRITLDVLEGNDVAINCYKKLGFEIDIKKGLQSRESLKYYEMNLNFKSFLKYFTKLKIVEILEFQSQPSHLQTLKDQINILFTKI